MNRSERRPIHREQTLPYVFHLSSCLGKGDGAYRYRRGRNPSPDVGGVGVTTGQPDTLSASTVAEAQALINSKDEKFDLVFANIV